MLEDEKRRYVKLSEAEWAQLEAEYSVGDSTLEELSARHGPSVRAIQMRFADRGISKGSATATLAAAVAERVHANALNDADALAAKARQAREDAFDGADLIERLVIGQLQAAQHDPAAASRMSGTLRALGLAAQTLERTHALKRAALGLQDNDLLGKELPRLVIDDITQEQIDRIQAGDDDSNDDDILDELPDLELSREFA